MQMHLFWFESQTPPLHKQEAGAYCAGECRLLRELFPLAA